MAMAAVDYAAMVAVDVAAAVVVAVVVAVEEEASTTLAPPPQPRKACVWPLVPISLTMGRRLLKTL